MSKKDPTTGLTINQEAFCQYYTADAARDPAKAYMEAYPRCKSQSTAYSESCRLLKNTKILQRISQLDQPALDKFEITRERVNLEKARIAFFDPQKLYHENGIPKKPHEIDKDTAAALAEIKTIVKGEGDNIQLEYIYKSNPKVTTLDQLSKQLGQYEQDNRQKGSTMDDLLDAVDGSTRGLPPEAEEDIDY